MTDNRAEYDTESPHYTIGGWGYNEDHPEVWHVVKDDYSICGQMSASLSSGAPGAFDWFLSVDSPEHADVTTYGRMCEKCRKAGGFDAVRA